MHVDNFRLLVNDFPASFKFWHDIVGLSLIHKDEATQVYAYFDAGSTRIELLKADYFASSIDGEQPDAAHNGLRAVVVIKVDDVDVTYADLLDRGAEPLAPPQDRPEWFCRTAHLKAPDGYALEIFKSIRQVPWEA